MHLRAQVECAEAFTLKYLHCEMIFTYVLVSSLQMNLEPGQEVFEVMIAANKVGLVIGTYTWCMKHFKYFKQEGSLRFPPPPLHLIRLSSYVSCA